MNDLNLWQTQFETLGIPNRKVELWKYSSVENFLPASDLESLKNKKTSSSNIIKNNLPLSFQKSQIIFDGKSWQSQNNEIQKVDAHKTLSSPSQQQLAQKDGLYNFHRSLQPSTIFKVKNTNVLCLNILLNAESNNAPELILDLSEHTGSLTIYEYLNGAEDQTGTLLYSVVVKNLQSDLKYHRFSNSSLSKNISWHQFENSSKLNLYLWKQNSQQAKEFLAINNLQENALSNTSLIANLKGDSHVDVTTQVNHLVAKTSALQSFKVILDDQAYCALTGKIFIDKNCPQTASFFKSKHSLLSDKAHIHSQPQLEIYSDDVECAHGSSTGSLQPEELFYLNSRGINTLQAKKMLLQAFLLDQINALPENDQKNYFKDLVL